MDEPGATTTVTETAGQSTLAAAWGAQRERAALQQSIIGAGELAWRRKGFLLLLCCKCQWLQAANLLSLCDASCTQLPVGEVLPRASTVRLTQHKRRNFSPACTLCFPADCLRRAHGAQFAARLLRPPLARSLARTAPRPIARLKALARVKCGDPARAL